MVVLPQFSKVGSHEANPRYLAFSSSRHLRASKYLQTLGSYVPMRIRCYSLGRNIIHSISRAGASTTCTARPLHLFAGPTSTTRLPLLRKVAEDGSGGNTVIQLHVCWLTDNRRRDLRRTVISIHPIPLAVSYHIALHRINSKCFSSNEAERLAIRYRRFNLDALLNAAVSILGNEASSCTVIIGLNFAVDSLLADRKLIILSQPGTKVSKCLEGQFNKAFLLTMNNGEEVLAKIPNPNAGSAFHTIASEVATRQFVSTIIFIKLISHINLALAAAGSVRFSGASYTHIFTRSNQPSWRRIYHRGESCGPNVRKHMAELAEGCTTGSGCPARGLGSEAFLSFIPASWLHLLQGRFRSQRNCSSKPRG